MLLGEYLSYAMMNLNSLNESLSSAAANVVQETAGCLLNSEVNEDPYVCDRCNKRLNDDLNECIGCGYRRRKAVKTDSSDDMDEDDEEYENDINYQLEQAYPEIGEEMKEFMYGYIDDNGHELDEAVEKEFDILISYYDNPDPTLSEKPSIVSEYEKFLSEEYDENSDEDDISDEEEDYTQEYKKYQVDVDRETLAEISSWRPEASRLIESSSSSSSQDSSPSSDQGTDNLDEEFEEYEDKIDEIEDKTSKIINEIRMEIEVFKGFLICDIIENDDTEEDSREILMERAEECISEHRKTYEPTDVMTAIKHMTMKYKESLDDNQLFYWGKALCKAFNIIEETLEINSLQMNIKFSNTLLIRLRDINIRILELNPKWAADEYDNRSYAEIKKEQSDTGLIINQELFSLLIQELGQDFKIDLQFEPEALEAIQTAAEEYLVDLLKTSNKLAIHAGRTYIIPEDMRLARSIKEN